MESKAERSAGQVVGPDNPAALWQLGQGLDPGQAPGGMLAADALVLAIDTSTRVGSVALCRGTEVVGEETWLAGGSQTSQVLPAATRLWERAGYGAGDLALVAVATGPGSFTGLRVGTSLGKGLAVALGIPIVGIPTLDVMAYQHREAAAYVCAVVEAGRGQLYYGTYRRWRGRLGRAGPYAVATIPELVAALKENSRPVYVCGELGAPAVGVLATALGARARVATPAASVRRAAYLAEMGRWDFLRRGAADAAALQPIYLRRATGETGHR